MFMLIQLYQRDFIRYCNDYNEKWHSKICPQAENCLTLGTVSKFSFVHKLTMYAILGITYYYCFAKVKSGNSVTSRL